MSDASTTVSLPEAQARLSELVRRVQRQHERITITREGEAEAVLLSADDLDDLEMTVEILAHTDSVTRLTESLGNLREGRSGDDLATMQAELTRRQASRGDSGA